MFDALIEGFFIVLHLKTFLILLMGCTVGFWIGILPGLGGNVAMAVMISFIYKMTPYEAFAFLLGMHSVCATTGDITSILFGIPGEGVSAATIVDGHPMAKKGEAGRACGAALMSSLVGAIIGAFSLALAVPIIRPLVLAFGSPEMFMLIVIGLTCVSSLSGHGKRGLFLGLMAGGFGFLLSLVGLDSHAAIHRFNLGTPYLWSGIPMIPVLIGIFAIPEVVDLAIRGTAISRDYGSETLGKGAMEGVKDTFRHFWLVVRCAIIGAWAGILPGLGGGVAQWLSYAHATHSAKTEEEQAGFGKGDVRGVLGPGAANNSKEGGALIPTIAFGIPSGPSMAILLGAFLVMGIVPGPEMLTKYLPLTFSMVWTIVIANIVVVAVCLLFINHLARLTRIRGNLIISVILVLCFIGAFTENNQLADLIVLMLFGGLGCFMVQFHWPRPPFILGFVLGNLAEGYLYTTISRYKAAWLFKPSVIILFSIAALIALYPFLKLKHIKGKLEPDEI